ncbi:DNA repair protein XRCC3 homolog [Chenopodium quinoa]|uniref:DNA repair protein XRCC3 homolog n=1 Tax=Chenopodium quinoa TaxID=63459 RepID=UPI000B78691C|nr:DNA repair protein XRCC3 homolog [Chenopodium quinoa]
MKPSILLHPNNQPITTPKLSLSCPILDRFLSGGIPCKSITEIVAESGSGKTQLCLQLLLSAQLPVTLGGFSASSLYLYTEFPFPDRRLRQLSLSFVDSYNTHLGSTSYDPLDKVLVQAVDDAHHLFDVLLKLDSFLVRRNKTQWPIKLIIIDSIAAVFRSDFDNTPADLKRRLSFFFKIAGKLRALAEKFGLAVVITNQVVDFVGNNEGINGLRIGNLACLYTSGRRVCPALGLSWANCVNTRLFISRSEEVVGEGSGFVEEDGKYSVNMRNRRHIHVVFAPHLPPSSCEFTIRREGVFGVESRDQFVANSSHR